MFSVNPSAWSAVDGLGRNLPLSDSVGKPRKNRFVAMFYWTWHADVSLSNKTAPNNTKILEEAEKNGTEPVWPKEGSYFWNEPVYGYYVTDDKWVLRKQAELLAAAEVDVVIFDNTNDISTWKTSYDALFETFASARRDGVKTPQISFILPFVPGENTNIQLHKLYEDIYKPGRYKDLWFMWEGKPLLMAHPEGLPEKDREIANFFTFRKNVPTYNTGDMSSDNWGWLSNYPQAVYYKKDGTAEQTSVGVAQNFSKEMGLTAMNGKNVFGRTYTSKGYDKRENAMLYGANFAQQFEYALDIDPEFIFITGWNEWVAGRFDEWERVKNAFPDEYNDEFSRDIEPSAGKLKDHYYYQLVSFIRRYKGAELPPQSKKNTVDIYCDDSAQWRGAAEYPSYAGNTFNRNHRGWGEHYYRDSSGRNDITLAKAVSDDENIYFCVQAEKALSPETDKNWMRLFIRTGSEKSWEGFDYVLNRNSPEKKAALERSSGGWQWESVGECDYCVFGNTLQVKIPRKMLGLEENFTIGFKWADNNLENGDIMELYTTGDTAPTARFCYCFSQSE